MATIKGKEVAWGITELEGVMIQSSDASLTYDTKEYKGAEGNTESIVEYNGRAEFSIEAVCLASTDESAVVATLETWCANEANTLFGLETGGSVEVSEYQISSANEEAKTLNITCVYYPYAKASA